MTPKMLQTFMFSLLTSPSFLSTYSGTGFAWVSCLTG